MPPKDVNSTRDAEIMVFTVQYNNERCKNDARAVLNAIDGVTMESRLPAGVTVENDNKDKPVRDETVTVTRGADARIPGKILQIFGSISNKKLVFNVTFENPNQKNDALEMVKELKGVLEAEFEPVDSKAKELTLKVKVDGSEQHEIIQKFLEKYGA